MTRDHNQASVAACASAAAIEYTYRNDDWYISEYRRPAELISVLFVCYRRRGISWVRGEWRVYDRFFPSNLAARYRLIEDKLNFPFLRFILKSFLNPPSLLNLSNSDCVKDEIWIFQFKVSFGSFSMKLPLDCCIGYNGMVNLFAFSENCLI